MSQRADPKRESREKGTETERGGQHMVHICAVKERRKKGTAMLGAGCLQMLAFFRSTLRTAHKRRRQTSQARQQQPRGTERQSKKQAHPSSSCCRILPEQSYPRCCRPAPSAMEAGLMEEECSQRCSADQCTSSPRRHHRLLQPVKTNAQKNKKISVHTAHSPARA